MCRQPAKRSRHEVVARLRHLPDTRQLGAPGQALAVSDWLTELSAVVWHRYEMPIRDLLEAETEYRNPAQQDLFEFDDPIPF